MVASGNTRALAAAAARCLARIEDSGTPTVTSTWRAPASATTTDDDGLESSTGEEGSWETVDLRLRESMEGASNSSEVMFMAGAGDGFGGGGSREQRSKGEGLSKRNMANKSDETRDASWRRRS